MKASVSLWSADILELGSAVDRVGPVADGFHLDVMDGHCVPNLLFGPDTVSALKARTKAALDVHMLLTRTDEWIPRLADAGADMLTVHRHLCRTVGESLVAIRSRGVKAGLVVELNDEINSEWLNFEKVDRLLLMGTDIGVKGVDIHPSIYDRIRRLAALREANNCSFEIFVDGGIRQQTVPRLAEAGADGVIPGSLVFGAADPVGVISWIHTLGTTGKAQR
jgi:ribulose-phosphate 3-epimerase